uniref:Uncharacterized protein n=1 Tax=Cacopsylla melanoneura TaxID=428564 RepID=A0A8D9E190_9HEMI
MMSFSLLIISFISLFLFFRISYNSLFLSFLVDIMFLISVETCMSNLNSILGELSKLTFLPLLSLGLELLSTVSLLTLSHLSLFLSIFPFFSLSFAFFLSLLPPNFNTLFSSLKLFFRFVFSGAVSSF